MCGGSPLPPQTRSWEKPLLRAASQASMMRTPRRARGSSQGHRQTHSGHATREVLICGDSTGTAPTRTNNTNRTCCLAQPCGAGSAPEWSMGRAGIEPATLGLKVDASFSRELAATVRMACLSRIHLACVRVLWERLVDPLLTRVVALRDTSFRTGRREWLLRSSNSTTPSHFGGSTTLEP